MRLFAGLREITARRTFDLKCANNDKELSNVCLYRYKVPRRPFESARLDAELKVCCFDCQT